jgi:hypothetical protein
MNRRQTATRLEWKLAPWQRPDGRWAISGTVIAHQSDGHSYVFLHCDEVFPFGTQTEAQEFIDDIGATYDAEEVGRVG